MKYYAVAVGRNPGIYTNWNDAKANVVSFPRAVYKSFSTKKEAEDFIARTLTPVSESADVGTVVYTDGSYKDGIGGFGVIVLDPNGDKYTIYGRVPLPSTNNVAELYAIYVAISMVPTDITIYTDSGYSIDALTYHVHEYVKKGWDGVPNAELIYSIYKLMGEDHPTRKISLKYVPGHTGHPLNEECDQLANTGRIQFESLVVLKNGEQISI